MSRVAVWTNVVAALLLAACAQQQNDKICIAPDMSKKDSEPVACVHWEAYQLAGAPGTSKSIAEAVVAGCLPVIQEFAGKDKEQEQDQLYSDVYELSMGLAHHYVTQARAGRCDVPSRSRE